MKKFLPIILCFFFLQNAQAQNGFNMNLIGNWDVDTLPQAGAFAYNDVWGWADCDGTEYAILGSREQVHFISLADPSTPTEVSAFVGGSNTTWRDMKTYKNAAYSVCDSCNEGLMVFDLEPLPAEVAQVAQITDFFTRCHNIYVDEAQGKLYAVGTNTMSNGIHVFDLNEDPLNPTLIAEFDLPGGYVHDMYVKDNIGYCSHGTSGKYWIYDFTDPANFVVLGNILDYPESGYNHASWVTPDGQYAVMADETFDRGLKLLDVSDPEDIIVKDVFRSELLAPDATGSIAHNPFIRGNYIISSYYHDGVQVFDFSDPENVVQVAGYDTDPDVNVYNNQFRGCWGTYPFLPSGLILGSDGTNGLFVLELTDITLPEMPRPLFPTEAVFSQVGDATVCEGDSLILQATSDASLFAWSNNGEEIAKEEEASLVIYDAGTYTLVASNGHCELAADDSLVVMTGVYPDLNYTAIETAICEGEVATLAVAEGAGFYSWQLDGESITNAQSNTYEATTSGTYTVIAGTDGCITTSDEVVVVVTAYPNVEITADPSLVICEGEMVTLSVAAGADAYQWMVQDATIENETASTLNLTEGGTYSVSAANGDCSVISDEVNVQVNVPITPIVTNTDVNTLTTGVFTSYQWFLDGEAIDGATSQELIIEASGSYIVETIDENGCTSSSFPMDYVLNSVTQLPEISNFTYYPNPVSDQLNVLLQSDKNHTYELTLVTVTGIQLATQVIAINEQAIVSFDTSRLPSGTYFLTLKGDNGVATRKVVK